MSDAPSRPGPPGDLEQLRALLGVWFDAPSSADDAAGLVAPHLTFNRAPAPPVQDGPIDILVSENQGVWLWGRTPKGVFVERENRPGAPWTTTGEDEVAFWLHHAAFEALWAMPATRSAMLLSAAQVEALVARTEPMPIGEWRWPGSNRIHRHGPALLSVSADGQGLWVVAAAPHEADLSWADGLGFTWDECDTRTPPAP